MESSIVAEPKSFDVVVPGLVLGVIALLSLIGVSIVGGLCLQSRQAEVAEMVSQVGLAYRCMKFADMEE